jgi:rSAM/selenodomain-associated transferase 1
MNRVAIFARWPIPGEVKSRLSPALPAAMACELYRAMLEDALFACEGAGAQERLLYWADAPVDRRAFGDPDGVLIRSQDGPALGERLARAFGELLIGPDDRAVAIGADCPELEPAIISEAFDLLASRDLVVGPASDGGYFLIGLRRAIPSLFEGVAWGTERVLEQTLEQATRAGLATALLDRLEDLDTPDDLVRFVARRALTAATTGQRTESALRAMGLLPSRL